MYGGIHFVDWLALGAYLVGITILGVWTAKRIKNTTDFFMGGRQFSKLMMVFFAFGAGTSGNQAVGVAAKSYERGFSGIWYQWLWLFATPFYWIIAPAFRRMRAITLGDFFQYRYSHSTAVLYAAVGILIHMTTMGVMLLASGKLVQAISGGAISSSVAIVVMTVLFLAYGVAGGLSAAIITDFIQGILTLVLSFLVLPFALQAVGGFAGLHEKISDPNVFELVAPGEINTFFIVMFALNVLVGIVTQPHVMGVCAAGRTELDGRVGFATGNLLKRFCTIAWMLTGVCAIALYQVDDADLVYGIVARDLLPQIFPGLVGLFLAALLASVMSSCDAYMVSSAGLFTQNIYRPLFAPGRTEAHYVLVGRLAAFGIVAGGLLFAFSLGDVPAGLKLFWKFTAIMAPAFWLGLYWRRATIQAAWASAFALGIVLVLTSQDFFKAWAVENLPETMIYTEVLVDGGIRQTFRESWQILFLLTAGFGTGLVVSLLTKPCPQAQLDRFFRCIHTPVNKGEPNPTEPFQLPEGIKAATPKLLINAGGLEVPAPTRLGLAGFFSFSLAVVAMIWFVRWMTTWGA